MDTIAERKLELRTDQGSMVVTVRLGRPEPDREHDCWRCQYEISFGDAVRTMAMHGIDGLQALQLSIATLDVELHHGAKKYGGVLYHYKELFNSVLESSGLQVRIAQKEA